MGLEIEEVVIRFRVPLSPGAPLERSVRAYLLMGEGVCAVDSGVQGSEHQLLEALERKGRRPGDLHSLVLTHAHPDHLGGAAGLRRSCACRVMVHGAELRWAQEPQVQCRERPVPGFEGLAGEGVVVDRELRDGEQVLVGGEDRLRVLHAPGHSPGSICLLHEPSGTLLCGDAVPVPGQLPVYDDAISSVGSLRKLLELKGVRRLLSAWDAPAEGAEAREALEKGVKFIASTHDLVRDALSNDPNLGKEELCRRCVAALDLPHQLATPLLGRTFEAHRRALMSGFRKLG